MRPARPFHKCPIRARLTCLGTTLLIELPQPARQSQQQNLAGGMDTREVIAVQNSWVTPHSGLGNRVAVEG